MNTVMLDEDMLLLRGSSLRNTDWVYGVAVYTGHETKVMMNSMQSRAKLSKLEIAANKYIIYGLVAQACLCAMAAGLIGLDFDGTLLRSDGTVSKRSVEALDAAAAKVAA